MSITLTIYPLRSPIDAGRGIVRIHPQIMDELGLDSWTPVKLTGARTTGALSAPGSPEFAPGACFVDAITALNAGVVAGKTVLAERLVARPATKLVLAIPHGLEALADPTAIVHALLGKVLFAGDRVSLLPQDFVRPEGEEDELISLTNYLAGVFGPGWQDVALVVSETDPPGGVHVASYTEAVWGAPSTAAEADDLLGIEVAPARGLDILMGGSPDAVGAGGSIPVPQTRIGSPLFPQVPLGSADADPFQRGLFAPSTQPQSMAPRAAPPPAPDLHASALANAGVQAMTPETEPPARLEDLGGMTEAIRSLREWFDVSFRQTEMLARLNISPLDGVLLHGLPGTGKSTLIRAIAEAEGAQLHVIEGRRFARTDPTSAAKRIREIFRSASAPPPQIIVIENIEALAPSESDEAKHSDTPLTSILIEELKAASARPAVAVVGITSHPERTSSELRGPGLLDHALEISPPTEAERREILAIHTRSLPISPDVSIDELARRTPGYVGADIQMLCRYAGVNAVIRLENAESSVEAPAPALPDHDTQPIEPLTELGDQSASPGAPTEADLLVMMADFELALDKISPTAMVDASIAIAKITFEDVGNMVETKSVLQEAVIWPIRFPDTFARLGLKPSRGVLLYGPPGCGKTFLVKALANEAEANFLAVKGAELLSKWVGESERAVREMFHRARSVSPAIIFFDEIDALAPTRGGSLDAATDRVVAQLLTELDGIEDLRDVWIVAATNRPDMVDPALVRPGRLDRMIYVPPPDEASRLEILKATCSQMPLTADVDLESIASRTNGFSGADLAGLARAAGLAVMRRDINASTITGADFEAAIAEIKPSLNKEDLAKLQEFSDSRKSL